MLGAIAGDIIGSVYESRPIKTKDFPLFDPRCRYTDDTVLTRAVAEPIVALLDSSCYEDAVHNAVSLGGDSDTLACITGGIAEAFYQEIPLAILRQIPQSLHACSLLLPDLAECISPGRFPGLFRTISDRGMS